MTNDRLNIIATDGNQSTPKKEGISKSSKRTTVKAVMDRLWLTNLASFNPLLTALGRARAKKTIELIDEYLNQDLTTPQDKKAADFGTGSGVFALHLSSKEVFVDAVDIATTAVQNLESKNSPWIRTFSDYIPHTTLESDFYDLVLGLDVIAYLERQEYRLFFAELARVVKLDGIVIASTPIDIYSEDALQNFAGLGESEFNIEKWSLSYHSYYIRLLSFFKAPSIFVKASKDKSFYEKELKKRVSIGRALFKFNCLKIVSFFWMGIEFLSRPIVNWLKQSDFILSKLEKLCRFISSETGISHAIFVGKKRKLFEEISAKEKPIERKGKRQVWE